MKKNGYLIIYFTTITIVLCISFSAIYQTYDELSEFQDGLDEHSKIVTFNDSSPYIVQDLIDYLQLLDIDFMVQKKSSVFFWKELYTSKDYVININWINGTFNNNGNHVVISDNLKKKSIPIFENGKEIIYLNQKKFQISGIYQNQASSIDNSTIGFMPLNTTKPLLGSYIITLSEENLDEGAIKSVFPNSQISFQKPRLSVGDRLSLSLQYNGPIALLLIIALVLIFISIVENTASWFCSHEKEIYIRRLVGSSISSIRFFMLKKYTFIYFLSFILGITICMLIVHLHLFNKIISSLNIAGISTSFLMILIIGILVLSLFFIKNRKKYTNTIL